MKQPICYQSKCRLNGMFGALSAVLMLFDFDSIHRSILLHSGSQRDPGSDRYFL